VYHIAHKLEIFVVQMIQQSMVWDIFMQHQLDLIA